jgi:hypothetical protein
MVQQGQLRKRTIGPRDYVRQYDVELISTTKLATQVSTAVVVQLLDLLDRHPELAAQLPAMANEEARHESPRGHDRRRLGQLATGGRAVRPDRRPAEHRDHDSGRTSHGHGRAHPSRRRRPGQARRRR